jgi:hypothetical protein
MAERIEVPGQIEMFPVPKPYRRPKRQQRGESWQKYRGKALSCDMCVTDLYQGIPDGPLEHAKVRWLREDGRAHMLCPRHEQAIKRGDRKIT